MVSVGALVGIAAVLASAVVLAVGARGLVRVNPTECVPRRGNQGWSHYLKFYAAGLFAAIFGAVTLQNEVGLWSVLPAYAVVLTPHLIISAVHRRRVGRLPAGRQG